MRKFFFSLLFVVFHFFAGAQHGTLDATFNPGTGANDAVYSMIQQPDGKILIGGFFTTYNGTARNRIARLNADGSLDASFNPGSGANDYVLSIARQSDGKILIGGYFTTYNGTARNYIARLNADGSQDASFNPGSGANDAVYSIVVQPDGQILIGGYFTTYNGTARNRIARLNADGSLDASFNPGSGADDFVYTIFPQPDGKILIGGVFTTYNGTIKNHIARLNADGSLDASFNSGSGTDGGVYCIIRQSDGKILIGGDFFSYNGIGRNHLARLNADGSLDPSFDPGAGPNNSGVYSMIQQSDGKILIGGQFTTYNGTNINRIARINNGVTTMISTSALSAASLCAGSTVSVPFTATGSFAAGNTFTAQLSNATGSFASPIAIGTLSGTASGTITATIPAATTSGTGYRIRVISSNPVVTGTDNGSDLRITRITATTSSTNIICNGGSNGTAAVNPSGGTTPYTYSWSPSGGSGSLATGLAAGIYTVTITDANGCTAQRSFTITQPQVLAASSLSVPAAGTYKDGDNLNFILNFSEPVTVITAGGTPYINIGLNGGITKQARYFSGSGTNSLAFVYTVGSTDQDPDGISMESTITLNGGTLQNQDDCTVSTSITGAPSLAGIKIHNPVTQTITFNALAGKTYGDADFDPGATASSGLTVTYTSSNTAVATIVAGKVHIVGAGSTTITASQPGNVNYKPAGNVQQTLSISAKALVVSAHAKTKTYGDADPVFTYGVSGLVGGDAVTGSLTRAAGNNVGPYAIHQGSLAAGDNYTILYNSANLTINPKTVTVTAQPHSKIYGEADPALTYTVSPALVSGDSFTGALGRVAGEGVGLYPIQQNTLALSSNYVLHYTTAPLTITKKAVTVTAQPQSKIYGGADPALTYSVSPALVAGDAFSGALSRTAGEDVGPYAIGQGSLSAGSNYTIAYTGANLTITPKVLTVTAEAKTKTYGEADPALTFTTSGLVGSDAVTGSLVRVAGNAVGVYPIQQGSLSAGGNYALIYNSATFAITAKELVVSAHAQTKTYGDPDPTLSYTITGLVGTDVPTGNLERIAGQNEGRYAINVGTLTGGPNYFITYTGANLEITKKVLAVSAHAKTKTYGDTDPALTYSVNGLVGSDAVTGSLTRAAGNNVGPYAIHQGSLTAGANYTITYTGADLTINPKAVTVTAQPHSKIYGDADPALTYTVSPALIGGDAFSGALSRVAGEGVGLYPIQQNTLALSSNYVLHYTAAPLTITKKAVTVTAQAQTKTYGDADPALTYTVTPALVSGDSFTGALGRVAGEGVGTYTIEQNTLALSGNYEITYSGAGLTITPKTVTVTAQAQTKTYGDADPALTYTVTPALVSGDAFSGALRREAGEAVGDYAIQQHTLALNGNYTLHYNDARLTIQKKGLAITADAQTKTYGDPDPVLTYSVSGLVSGDAVNGSLVRTPGNDVGTYTIEQGTLTASNNYTLTYTGAGLTINPKTLVVNAIDQTKTYGDADPALTYSVTGLVGSDAITGSPTRISGDNVGVYPIQQGSLSAGGNYALIYNSATFAITAKELVVSAHAQTKTYGDPDPTLSYTITGLVGTDAVSGALVRTPGNDVGTYPIQQGSLTAGGNYTITYTGTDLTISPKAVTVAAQPHSKIYGDADPALTYTVSPALVSGDSFTGALGRVAGEGVGLYPIQQNTLALSSNYVLHYTTAPLTITKKAVTVKAEAQTKTYGDADPALTYTVTPALVSGDAFSGALRREAGEAVGDYVIQQHTLALNGNYILNFDDARLTIQKKGLVISAQTQSKTYGDSDPALTYSVTGLVGTDAVSGGLVRTPGNNVGKYAIQQGSLTAGSNYTITYTGAELTITPKAVTVAAQPQSKIYGETDPALTYSVSPALVGGDAFSGSLSRAAGENAGTYAIGQGSLTNPNYAIFFTGGVLTIEKAPQQITWSQTLTTGCDGITRITLTATASSGLPVSYSSADNGIATINNNEVVMTGAGTVTLMALQPGNHNYLPAAPVSNTMIAKLPSHLVLKRWDDVLVFDNSSNQYTEWKWYKNGMPISGATGQYFYESGKLNGSYHAVVKTKAGVTQETCPVTITPATTIIPIAIFPNPAAPGQTISVKMGYSAAELQGASIIVSNMLGVVVQTVQNVAPQTNITMPITPGVFVIKLRLANGVTASVNALVKPQ